MKWFANPIVSGIIRKFGGDPSRRRDCHFADIPSPSLLKHLLKGEVVGWGVVCSRMTVSPTGVGDPPPKPLPVTKAVFESVGPGGEVVERREVTAVVTAMIRRNGCSNFSHGMCARSARSAPSLLDPSLPLLDPSLPFLDPSLPFLDALPLPVPLRGCGWQLDTILAGPPARV